MGRAGQLAEDQRQARRRRQRDGPPRQTRPASPTPDLRRDHQQQQQAEGHDMRHQAQHAPAGRHGRSPRHRLPVRPDRPPRVPRRPQQRQPQTDQIVEPTVQQKGVDRRQYCDPRPPASPAEPGTMQRDHPERRQQHGQCDEQLPGEGERHHLRQPRHHEVHRHVGDERPLDAKHRPQRRAGRAGCQHMQARQMNRIIDQQRDARRRHRQQHQQRQRREGRAVTPPPRRAAPPLGPVQTVLAGRPVRQRRSQIRHRGCPCCAPSPPKARDRRSGSRQTGAATSRSRQPRPPDTAATP